MQKKIKVSLKAKKEIMNYEVIGNVTEDEIYYEELDDKHTNVMYSLKDNVLKRDNEELYMEYHFNEPSKSNILIKDLGQNIKVDLKNIKLNKTDKGITINYEVNDVGYKYSLRIKEK